MQAEASIEEQMAPIVNGMEYLMKDKSSFQDKLEALGKTLNQSDLNVVLKTSQCELFRILFKRPRYK